MTEIGQSWTNFTQIMGIFIGALTPKHMVYTYMKQHGKKGCFFFAAECITGILHLKFKHIEFHEKRVFLL